MCLVMLVKARDEVSMLKKEEGEVRHQSFLKYSESRRLGGKIIRGGIGSKHSPGDIHEQPFKSEPAKVTHSADCSSKRDYPLSTSRLFTSKSPKTLGLAHEEGEHSSKLRILNARASIIPKASTYAPLFLLGNN